MSYHGSWRRRLLRGKQVRRSEKWKAKMELGVKERTRPVGRPVLQFNMKEIE